MKQGLKMSKFESLCPKEHIRSSSRCADPEHGHPGSHCARIQTDAGCKGPPPGQNHPQSLYLTQVELGVASCGVCEGVGS